jgi:hypothetical protein
MSRVRSSVNVFAPPDSARMQPKPGGPVSDLEVPPLDAGLVGLDGQASGRPYYGAGSVAASGA